MRYNYSDNEKKMLVCCGVDDERIFNLVSPMMLYRSIAISCFSSNRQGPEVEALRRATYAIEDSTVFRGTDDFEKLIEF